MDIEFKLPNKINFLVKRKKQYFKKPLNYHLTWTNRRRKLKAETTRNDIVNEIASYVGKMISSNRQMKKSAVRRSKVKTSEGKIFNEQGKENTILSYFKNI